LPSAKGCCHIFAKRNKKAPIAFGKRPGPHFCEAEQKNTVRLPKGINRQNEARKNPNFAAIN
jgi:hypothetical protein